MGLKIVGAIAEFLSFRRVVKSGAKFAEIQFDLGGGDVRTGAQFLTPGDDAQPHKNDRPLTLAIKRTGSRVVIGFIDPANDGKSGPGERRFYARNAAGLPVSEFWLKADGSILAVNAFGSAELQANGNYVINGVTIDPMGNITTPAAIAAGTSLKVAELEVLGHVHVSAAPGINTGPMVPPPAP